MAKDYTPSALELRALEAHLRVLQEAGRTLSGANESLVRKIYDAARALPRTAQTAAILQLAGELLALVGHQPPSADPDLSASPLVEAPAPNAKKAAAAARKAAMAQADVAAAQAKAQAEQQAAQAELAAEQAEQPAPAAPPKKADPGAVARAKKVATATAKGQPPDPEAEEDEEEPELDEDGNPIEPEEGEEKLGPDGKPAQPMGADGKPATYREPPEPKEPVCDGCGRPLLEGEVERFGSLCEACARAAKARPENPDQPRAIPEASMVQHGGEDSGYLLEAPGGGSGRSWRIVAIRSGVSMNGRLWEPEVVKTMAPMLEGVDVFADHDPPQARGQYPVRRIGDKIGFLRDVNPKDDGAGGVVVEATFEVVSAPWRETLKNAWDAGRPDFVQFSVNAIGDDPPAVVNGQRVRRVQDVRFVRSVDAVTEGAAGGRLLTLLEHYQEDEMTREEMQALAEEVSRATINELAGLAEDDEDEEFDEDMDDGEEYEDDEDDDVVGLVTEAVGQLQDELESLRAERAALASQARIEAGLSGSRLPKPAAERARKLLEALSTRREVTDDDVTSVIQEERNYAASFAAQAPLHVARPGDPTVGGMVSPLDNYQLQLRGMLAGRDLKDGEGKTIPAFRSMKEAWCRWNPSADPFSSALPRAMMREIAKASGYDSEVDHGRLQESIGTSTWGEIFADNLYVVLIDAYRELPYDDWRKLFTIDRNVNDFRTRHWTRMGGYGDLPDVSEGAAYQPATSPGDDEVTWAVTKRGMLEASITIEAIANDNVQALARIPRELAIAAKRTCYKFFMNMLTTTNPTLDYDSVALYHAGSHLNSGTTALSVAGLEAVEIAMAAQTARQNSNETLGPRNMPKYLVLPRALANRAERIVNPSQGYAYALSSTPDADTSLDPAAYAGRGIEIVVNDYLTNAKDWWTFRDPNMAPIAVAGFFGGREEPEIFVQNDPQSGTMFNNDTQAIKVRHIYGGDVIDHTGCYYQDVA